MRGNGFYTWRECPLWKELAQGWYRFWKSKGHYEGDRDQLGVVVYVVARTVPERYLDLTEQVIANRVAEHAKRSGINIKDVRAIGAAYEYCIKEIELDAGAEFDVIETTVGPPPDPFCLSYSVLLLPFFRRPAYRYLPPP